MVAVSVAHRWAAVAAVALLVACGGRRVAVGPAPSAPEETVAQFLSAVNAADLTRMAGLWGDERGPSSATNVIPENERVRRLQIIQRVLLHDTHRVVESNAEGADRRVLQVELARGTRRVTVPFTLVVARTGGWVINQIGLEAAMPQPSLPRQGT
jgi:hypothetical protein